jgi:glycosyltransferase involved in cell wall biosynthesis
MSSPALSVVIASVNGLPYLERCLESLERQAPDTEVIVADWTDVDTRRTVCERWPAVRLLSFDEPMAVPELRAAWIAAARAPYVAVIEDHCVVRDGWARRLVDAHRNGHPVVGGPIRNGETRRLRDWAAFFCEYSEYMEPGPTGPVPTLVGMNVSYDRHAIEAMEDLLRAGRWETWLHPRLQTSGFELYSDGEAGLDHVKDFGFREFLSQRWHYARSHAGMLNPQLGRRRIVYILGSPALVPLLYARIARSVMRKRAHRLRFLAASPLVLVYLSVWAAGEALGYAFGGGRSLLKVR